MREHPAGFVISAEFLPPPARPLPQRGELFAVVFALDVPAERLQTLRASFSPREDERFRSFAHDEHRARWGASRGMLREVLGAALDLPPPEIAFAIGQHGKPEVHAAQQPREKLRFNLSHSGGLGLLALARDVEVGADVELPSPRRTDDLARRWFAPAEQERVVGSPDEFFNLWTCKEAFLKATGEGLSRSLRSYEISADARLLYADGIPDAERRYAIFPLRPGEPYRAAIVAESHGLTLRRFRWP